MTHTQNVTNMFCSYKTSFRSQVFLQRPQRTLSRDQLLDLTHGREAKAFDRSIDNLISRLRRKVELDTTNPKIIKTVRGGGYTLAMPVSKIFKNA